MNALMPRSLYTLFILATLLAAGCSQSIEKNIAFQEQVGRADRLHEELKVLNRQLSMLDTQFQQVSKQVVRIKTGGAGGGGNASQALQQRLIRLEKAQAASQKTLSAIQAYFEGQAATKMQVTVAAVQAPSPGSAGPASAAKANSSGKQAARLMVVGKKNEAGKSEAKTNPPRPANPMGGQAVTRAIRNQPRLPSGLYHDVKNGQTIDTIAASYSVDPSMLRSANRLPAQARVIAGQRIYVPRAMN